LRTNEFYNAGGLTVTFGDDVIRCDGGFYEVLEPSTAKVLASFNSVPGAPPAITANIFGKAIYVWHPIVVLRARVRI
jgi:beta-galactosidase